MNTIVNTTVNTTGNTETTTPAYGLKWHKFLVYFSLWAGAILNAIFGFMCFVEGAPLYGILMIASAAYTIYVRFLLAKFKKNAYKHLFAAQLIIIAVDILLMGAEFSSLASSVAACGINYFYYKKREEMFVN